MEPGRREPLIKQVTWPLWELDEGTYFPKTEPQEMARWTRDKKSEEFPCPVGLWLALEQRAPNWRSLLPAKAFLSQTAPESHCKALPAGQPRLTGNPGVKHAGLVEPENSWPVQLSRDT